MEAEAVTQTEKIVEAKAALPRKQCLAVMLV
jgi:hypothetical protein